MQILLVINIIFVIFIELAILPLFSWQGAVLNLILVIVVAWLFHNNSRRSFYWALFGGIGLDLLTTRFFGIRTLSYLLAWLVIYYLIISVFRQTNAILKIMLIALATLVYHISYFIFSFLLSVIKLVPNNLYFSKDLFISLVIEMVLNIIAFLLIDRILKLYKDFYSWIKLRKKVKEIA